MLSKGVAEGLARSISGVILLVGAGFAVSGLQSVWLAGGLWLLGFGWLAVNVWGWTRDRVPRIVLSRSVARATADAGNRSRMLHKALRPVPTSAGVPDYRDALRQVARLLYVSEGLYAQASGAGEISEEAQWAEEAPKDWWGDPLYGLLGIPAEERYR